MGTGLKGNFKVQVVVTAIGHSCLQKAAKLSIQIKELLRKLITHWNITFHDDWTCLCQQNLMVK